MFPGVTGTRLMHRLEYPTMANQTKLFRFGIDLFYLLCVDNQRAE